MTGPERSPWRTGSPMWVGSTSSGQGTLFAFDQNGPCSSGTCNPVFQTSEGPGFPAPVNLAVSGTTVYGTTSGGSLVAFDGAGCGGQASCTGTLWNTGDISADGGGNLLAPSVTTAPRTSPTEWSTWASSMDWEQVEQVGGLTPDNSTSGTLIKSYPSPDNGAVYNSPIVANGVLYFGTANGSIYAYAPS